MAAILGLNAWFLSDEGSKEVPVNVHNSHRGATKLVLELSYAPLGLPSDLVASWADEQAAETLAVLEEQKALGDLAAYVATPSKVATVDTNELRLTAVEATQPAAWSEVPYRESTSWWSQAQQSRLGGAIPQEFAYLLPADYRHISGLTVAHAEFSLMIHEPVSRVFIGISNAAIGHTMLNLQLLASSKELRFARPDIVATTAAAAPPQRFPHEPPGTPIAAPPLLEPQPSVIADQPASVSRRPIVGPGHPRAQDTVRLEPIATENEPVTGQLPEPEKDSVQVDVWFGTNRQRTQHRQPSEAFSHRLDKSLGASYHCGIAHVEVPLDAGRRKGTLGTPFLKRLMRGDLRDDWLSVRELRHFASPESFFHTMRGFGNAITNDSCLLYIHGYNVSFRDCILRAAQLTFDLEHDGLCAAFSWPSRGKVRGYVKDKTAVEQSEANLADFVRRLALDAGVRDVHVIAHSMGNVGLIRAIQRIAPTLKEQGVQLGQIVLAAPDVDAVAFRDLARVYPEICKRATLYASAKDKALRVSKWIQDDRAGFEPPVTTVEGIDTVVVSNIDLDSIFGLGHGMYAEARELLADINTLLIADREPPRFAMTRRNDERGEEYWELV